MIIVTYVTYIDKIELIIGKLEVLKMETFFYFHLTKRNIS
nr:MAG: hypothetical protein H3Bulk424003_000001 [Mitovirus sp.]